MSLRPSESVYGVARPASAYADTTVSSRSSDDDSHAEPNQPGGGSGVEWANAELVSIASTIQELQGRLEAANSKLESASQVESTEFEIGRLFVEAQRFSEESLSKLETHIHQILTEVEAKAAQILMEATQEAQEIRRNAQGAAIAATKAARELQSAIAGFTEVNNELVKELSTLNTMLMPAADSSIAEFDTVSDTPQGD